MAGGVEVVSSLEGAAAATMGVVTWTLSAGGAVTVTVFASAPVLTLADVAGEGLQVGVGTAGGFAVDVSTTETAVSCLHAAT